MAMDPTDVENSPTDGPPCPVCSRPMTMSLVKLQSPLVVAYSCGVHGLMSYRLPFQP